LTLNHNEILKDNIFRDNIFKDNIFKDNIFRDIIRQQSTAIKKPPFKKQQQKTSIKE